MSDYTPEERLRYVVRNAEKWLADIRILSREDAVWAMAELDALRAERDALGAQGAKMRGALEDVSRTMFGGHLQEVGKCPTCGGYMGSISMPKCGECLQKQIESSLAFDLTQAAERHTALEDLWASEKRYDKAETEYTRAVGEYGAAERIKAADEAFGQAAHDVNAAKDRLAILDEQNGGT